MQASLSDLAAKPGTASFAKCRRLFNLAQHIIFGDALLENTIEAHQKRRKLKLCRTKPAVVGMAVVLSAIGLPALAEFPGQMTLEEGRKPQNSNSGHIDQDVLHVSEAEDSDTDSYHDVVGPENMGSSPSTREKQVTNAHRENESTLFKVSRKSFKSTHASERGYAHGLASYLPGPPLPPVGNMSFEALNPRKFSLRNSMSARKASWTPALSSPSNPADRLGQSHSMVNLSKSSSLYRSATSPSAMQAEDWNCHVGDGEALLGDDTGSSYDANDTSPPHRVPDKSESHPASIYSQASRSAGYSTATDMSRKSPAARSALVQSPIATPHLAASSTPSFHPYSKSANNLGDRQEENANISLPSATLSLLLRSYACRSQLNLLTCLQDIATRLIVVPKLARLSALRAELTVLNHSLPRGCCLCLGCSGEGTGSLVSTDGDDGNKGPLTSTFKSIFSRSSSNKVKKRAHHRIVRISPSESVVLNSADRAPFLIHVEILEGDLDFDPSRRQNAEDVRSVLAERDGKISKSRSSGTELLRLEHSASASVALGSIRAHTSAYAPVASERDSCNTSPVGNSEITIGQSASNMPTASDRGDLQSPPENVEEEVDLVEQLYGSFSVHDVADLTTPEYHPEIHNRSVEERAWQQAERRKSLHSRQNSLESRPVPSTDTESGLPRQRQRKPMTIDDYAERMRMAAIMLAQLNASQQQPLSRTDAVTGAVGAGVGMGVNITYGVGSVVGSVFGVGIDVVRAGLGSRRRSSLDSANPPSVGQAGAGVAAPVDTSRAVTGFSSIVDNSSPTSLVTPLTSHQSQLHTQASTFSGSATPASHIPPRSRLLSPQDASTIRDRIMKEMMALEDERMARMKALTQSARTPILAANHTADSVEEETVVMRAINKEDPSGSVLSESWTEKKSRIRKGSPYGHLLSWDVFSVIVKTGADLRQEQLAVQLIKEFGRIWSESKSPHWIRL